MKQTIASFLFFLFFYNVNAQEIIATSVHPFATANHNQRKIARDSEENIYVVFTDSLNDGLSIAALYLNRVTETWSNAAFIADGTNPTLAVGRDDKIFLLYQSNDTVSQIICQYTMNFSDWSESIVFSDTNRSCFLPVADCDSSGTLNAFWVQENEDGADSLQYGKFQNGELIMTTSIAGKDSIKDIAIANHLVYTNNDVYFAYQSADDSILFCSSGNYLQSVDTVNISIGSQPGLTFNSYTGLPNANDNHIPMLYLDKNQNLIENLYIDYGGSGFHDEVLQPGKIDYICIDDIMPPLGYSYLFQKNDSLFHGFSMGFGYTGILQDTISTYPIYPSMAYKHFSSEYIDFVWMQESGTEFTIHYRRDDKYEYIYKGIDVGQTRDFKVTGYPNPFRDVLNIQVEVTDYDKVPLIEIYDTGSKKIASLHPESITGNKYHYAWNTTESDRHTPPGLYFVRCTVGISRTAKKVIKAY